MTAKIISGTEIAKQIREELKKYLEEGWDSKSKSITNPESAIIITTTKIIESIFITTTHISLIDQR